MRQFDFALSGGDCQRGTVAWIVLMLGFSDQGRCVSARLLGRIVVLACCLRGSLSGVCRRMSKTPSSEAIRLALHASLPEDVPTLEERIHRGLTQPLPRAVFKRPRRLAIDLHQRPYYGRRESQHSKSQHGKSQRHSSQGYSSQGHERVPVRGGKAKAGTKWFWAYATVALVERGERWTLFLTQVRPDEPLEQVVARLLDHVQTLGISIKVLLVDREFYGARIIGLFQDRRVPFLMPAVRRGRLGEGQSQAASGKDSTGTRRFFVPGTFGLFEHEWTARGKSNGRRVRVRIACVPRKARDRRRSSRVSSPQVFAFDGFSAGRLFWYREMYRKRFGIETSYRQLGEALARTTSKSPLWRLLLVGIALLMRNLWVWSNQQTPRHITLSEQLHHLNLLLSHQLGLTLNFETACPPTTSAIT